MALAMEPAANTNKGNSRVASRQMKRDFTPNEKKLAKQIVAAMQNVSNRPATRIPR